MCMCLQDLGVSVVDSCPVREVRFGIGHLGKLTLN